MKHVSMYHHTLSSCTFQEENDSLRCQLEAYKNEVDLVRADLKTELNMKEQQLKMIQQTMQGLQQVRQVYLLKQNGEK